MDPRSLPIGPQEAFVLSRVDGRTTQADLSSVTGLNDHAVGAVLDRLEELGAIQFYLNEPPEKPRRGVSSVHERARSTGMESEDRQGARQASAMLYDPTELDEACDLSMAFKRTVLDLFYRLDRLNYYELLNVPSDAEKKNIKESYFSCVGLFHPDRYFGKNLGTFRSKIEQIFQRLTEAHDALTRKKTRQEYDEYLSTRGHPRPPREVDHGERVRERGLENAPARPAEAWFGQGRPAHAQTNVAAPLGQTERHAASPERQRSSSTPASPTAEPTRSAASPPAGARGPSVPSPAPDVRRRAFARRMSGRSSPVIVPPQGHAETQRQVAENLKRMYADRVEQARETQVEVYLRAADEALASDNPVSAANALRVAASLVPDDSKLQQHLAATERQANAKLADSYLQQGQRDEREQRWEAAARSYQRAALGRPSAEVHERVAYCLLMAKGDMRVATDHAKRAVSLAPEAASPRVTLARVYLEAGMRQSAVAELERAQAIAPQDGTIKDWLKRIRRSQV